MQVRAKAMGFIGGAVKQPGDVFEADQPASWYAPVDAKPAKGKGKAAEAADTQPKVDPAAPAGDLT